MRSRTSAALDDLSRLIARLQREIADWEEAASRLAGGKVGIRQGLLDFLGAVGVEITVLRDQLRRDLILRYGETFTFGDQTMRFEDMSYEELLAAQTLLQMQGSSEPVTPEQMEVLASYFNLDGEWMKENLATTSQGDLYNLLTQSGLIWDHNASAVGDMPHWEEMQQEMMPGTAQTIPGWIRSVLERVGIDLRVPAYQRQLSQARYGINQQLLELGLLREGGLINDQQYEKGQEFIQAVHKGSAVFTVSESGIAPVISLGTTGVEDLISGHHPPSHVMIGTGEGVLVSAEPHGVVYRRAIDVFWEQGLKPIREGHPDVVQIWVREVPGDFDRDAAAAYAADKVGSRYDFEGLLTPVQSSRAWYCSEITGKALEAGGVRLDIREGLTPQDVAEGPVAGLAGGVAGVATSKVVRFGGGMVEKAGEMVGVVGDLADGAVDSMGRDRGGLAGGVMKFFGGAIKEASNKIREVGDAIKETGHQVSNLDRVVGVGVGIEIARRGTMPGWGLAWDISQVSPEELLQARIGGKALVETYKYTFSAGT